MPTTPAPMPLTSWGAMWFNGPAEIQITNPPGNLNGLADSRDVKTAADEANKKLEEAKKMPTTVSALYEDAQEAFVGIIGDLLGESERKSLKDIFTSGNRLRGLGIVFVTLAIAGWLVHFLLGTEATNSKSFGSLPSSLTDLL